MKKIFFLLTAAFFGIFSLAGCGKINEQINTAMANTAANQNVAAKTNTAATKTDEPAATILKPGDVSPGKAVKVVDLADSVAAGGKDAWKGKEVTVTGFVSGMSNSGNHQLVTLTSEQLATNKKSVTCAFQGDKPDVFSKTIEVKGKISYFEDGEYKTVELDPCEIKK